MFKFDEEDRWFNLYFKNKHVECVSTIDMIWETREARPSRFERKLWCIYLTNFFFWFCFKRGDWGRNRSDSISRLAETFLLFLWCDLCPPGQHCWIRAFLSIYKDKKKKGKLLKMLFTQGLPSLNSIKKKIVWAWAWCDPNYSRETV